MEKLCVILLSYKRQQNIQFIAETILKCPFVDKLIISNSNPEFEIDPWVDIKDDRLEIINHQSKQGCGSRWDILRKQPYDFFMSIDDDVFLKPEQIETLFNQLVADGSRPHGLFGSNWKILDYETKLLDRHFSAEIDKTVDLIHQVYAVKKKHIEKYFELRDVLLSKTPDVVSYIDAFSDDILISHCGTAKPKVHNADKLTECKTKAKDGIALCAAEDFLSKRADVYYHLTETRSDLLD